MRFFDNPGRKSVRMAAGSLELGNWQDWKNSLWVVNQDSRAAVLIAQMTVTFFTSG